VREGAALLQGLATCGNCGRKLRVAYSGRNANPAYHCAGSHIANGRGEYCLWIGGRQIDQAVAAAFLKALAPAGLQAAIAATEQLESDEDAAVAQFRLQVERARYETQRAERRYRAVDPENRLVARGLETEWEKCLQKLHSAEADLARRQERASVALTTEQRAAILSLGRDVDHVWTAPTTTDRDRKELLRTLVEEVVLNVKRDDERAHLTMRWYGSLLTELDVSLPRSRPAPIRTSDNLVDLVRRLAVHYTDAVIAGILNRQGKTTATGMRFNANRVSSLRTHWQIPCCKQSPQEHEEEQADIVTIDRAAEILGIASSTVHRWLNDGFIAGEQLTPGAPWRIRMTEKLRSLFVAQAPEGYIPMIDATRILGVSRQTVLQRVKRGELEAVHICSGRRKGLRIKVPDALPGLFDSHSTDGGAV